MAITCRLAVIEGMVYAERVPNFWVEIGGRDHFLAGSTSDKVYAVQMALAKNADFEFLHSQDQIL